jgi:hypothetical protein
MSSRDERRLNEFKLRIDQQVRHLLNAGYEIDILSASLLLHRGSDPYPMDIEFKLDFREESLLETFETASTSMYLLAESGAMPTPEEIQAEKDRLAELERQNNEDMAKKGEENPYGDK